jgi:hypothetical protein
MALKDDNAAFADAFDNDNFGLQPIGGEADGAAVEPGVSGIADTGLAGSDSATASTSGGAASPEVEEEVGEATVPEAGATGVEEPAAVGDATSGTPDDSKPPMTEQQLRSWQGRLKKAEEDLKKAGATEGKKPDEEAAEAIEQVGEQAEDTGNTALAEGAEQLGEQVESGEISAEDAFKQLSEDFGEPFVKMIEAVARKIAAEAGSQAGSDKAGELGKTLDELISSISSDKERKHYEQIAEAHPDFNEIDGSGTFKAWLDGLPETAKAKAMKTVEGGSAKDVIALLDDYKAAHPDDAAEEAVESPSVEAAEEKQEAKAGTTSNDAALDAAEGVRSGGGMRLPEEPKSNKQDYASAWDKF